MFIDKRLKHVSRRRLRPVYGRLRLLPVQQIDSNRSIGTACLSLGF